MFDRSGKGDERVKRGVVMVAAGCLLLAGAAWALTFVFNSSLGAGGPATRAGDEATASDRSKTSIVSALFAETSAPPDPFVPAVRARDAVTGRSLDADVLLQSLARADAARTGKLGIAGARLAPLSKGDYQLSIAAAGYRPLATSFRVDGARALPMMFWLQPEQTPADQERRALRAVECGSCSVVAGHAYDRDSGRPLAGLRIVSDRGGHALTDAAGAFELLLPVSPGTSARTDALPETTMVTISGNGYQQQLRNVSLYHDSHDLILDLARGAQASSNLAHVQSQAQIGAARTRSAVSPVEAALEAERVAADRDKALDPQDVARSALARQLASKAARIPVPTSIRVGTNCSGRSCTGVSVYAFEDYVGRGLDDEWIASWQANSLAAGAIAYRTYGAYYVAHPVNSRYDICSSTSCQVFGSGSVSATVAAAATTRGVLLTRDGQTAAFSEYSAENNAWDDPTDGLSCSNPDLSCGNGRNGSPRNNWPCLSDSVGQGRGCFGHGRGMSQWGTQRWAANHGRGWEWITNHYYNGNGNPGGMRNAFLANLDTGGVGTMLDNFEQGVGHFTTSPTYSGSTVGIAASSVAERTCSIRYAGSCSLHVGLVDDASSQANWLVRLLSGAGNPAANVALARNGRVGLWAYSGGSGMRLGVGIDDSDGTERSVTRAIAANAWTYVEWTLADAAQWNAWAGGSDGAITAATVKLDAVWLERAQTSYPVNVYVDDVQLKLAAAATASRSTSTANNGEGAPLYQH